MKKLISLFLVVAMLSSFAIVANAETKMTFNINWFGTKTNGFTGVTSVDFDKMIDSAKAGDKVAAVVYVPAGANLGSTKFYLDYDASILDVTSTSDTVATINEEKKGTFTVSYAAAPPNTAMNIFVTIMFTVKAEPVKTLDSILSFRLATDASAKHSCYPNYTSGNLGDEVLFGADEVAINVAGLTIEGLKEVTKEFAVEAKLVDGKVVVTAENIGENAGTVYVATFNGGVLVDCEAKALADIADGWTVENLDGTAADAQIFVWNDQNVPLFDNVITVSAE